MDREYQEHKKILITGAKGMLGSMLVKVFSDYEVIEWDLQSGNDITNEDAVMKSVKEIKPDVIINAAAFTEVDKCEDAEFQGLADLVNGAGPRILAIAAKEVGAILVHFSTDYIFNGENKEGYSEEFDKINPVNYYGKSKAVGEKNIMQIADDNWNKYYIIRTAWLYGPNGNNFVDTMIKLGKEKDELKVVNDQHGSPTYTKDLAERTKELLLSQLEFGVYHGTNNEFCTWYDFAKEIFKIAKIDIDVQPCSSEEFPRPAKRPAYSMLHNTKMPPMRRWQEALADYISTSL